MPVEKGKVGQFFIFIGLILLVVFFISSLGRIPAFGYLLGGLGLMGLGGYLYIQDRPPVDPNTARFRTVRKMRERREKRSEKRDIRREEREVRKEEREKRQRK
jgi:hypothetical protein